MDREVVVFCGRVVNISMGGTTNCALVTLRADGASMHAALTPTQAAEVRLGEELEVVLRRASSAGALPAKTESPKTGMEVEVRLPGRVESFEATTGFQSPPEAAVQSSRLSNMHVTFNLPSDASPEHISSILRRVLEGQSAEGSSAAS
jgi:hypothetical protein